MLSERENHVKLILLFAMYTHKNRQVVTDLKTTAMLIEIKGNQGKYGCFLEWPIQNWGF